MMLVFFCYLSMGKLHVFYVSCIGFHSSDILCFNIGFYFPSVWVQSTMFKYRKGLIINSFLYSNFQKNHARCTVHTSESQKVLKCFRFQCVHCILANLIHSKGYFSFVKWIFFIVECMCIHDTTAIKQANKRMFVLPLTYLSRIFPLFYTCLYPEFFISFVSIE